MKKVVLFTIFAALMMISSAAVAQTASGNLTVNATVQGSIQLVFNTDGSGVALSSGAGTANATLNFGNISAFGALAGNVTRTTTATTFTVSTPVDVLVSATNTTSANYKLQAQLASNPAPNSFTIGGVSVTNTALSANITSTGTYGSNVGFPVAITVPFSNTTALNISNVITYTATAN